MQEILAESGLTKSAFAKRCRVSRVSVDKWCKGAIPKNRETFLRIGMAAEYDLEKMNQLLRDTGSTRSFIRRAWKIVYVSMC